MLLVDCPVFDIHHFVMGQKDRVDIEVQALIENAYETAKRILTEKRDQLDTLAKGLLEYETLSGQEIKDLLDGKIPMR